MFAEVMVVWCEDFGIDLDRCIFWADGGLEVESDDTFEYVMKFNIGVEIPLVLWVLPKEKFIQAFPAFMPQNDGEEESAEKEETCHDEPQCGEDVVHGVSVQASFCL